MHFQLAKTRSEPNVLLSRKRLVTKENDLALHQQSLQKLNHCITERLGQVNAQYLCANHRAEMMQIKPQSRFVFDSLALNMVRTQHLYPLERQ